MPIKVKDKKKAFKIGITSLVVIVLIGVIFGAWAAISSGFFGSAAAALFRRLHREDQELDTNLERIDSEAKKANSEIEKRHSESKIKLDLQDEEIKKSISKTVRDTPIHKIKEKINEELTSEDL